MGQRILNVRVRPSRVAVLISKAATQDDLLLGLKFLSHLWGGRFCQLLPVEPNGEDSLAAFRLSQSRPDFVYGMGIDDWPLSARVTHMPSNRVPGLPFLFVRNLS